MTRAPHSRIVSAIDTNLPPPFRSENGPATTRTADASNEKNAVSAPAIARLAPGPARQFSSAQGSIANCASPITTAPSYPACAATSCESAPKKCPACSAQPRSSTCNTRTALSINCRNLRQRRRLLIRSPISVKLREQMDRQTDTACAVRTRIDALPSRWCPNPYEAATSPSAPT